MNMISTGAFQNEMDASNKQTTLAGKFAAAWEKKNAKAARAGGVSLMALSLAACGSDDATTSSTDTSSSTTTTSAASQALALTVGKDDLSGGTGNDTFTAAKSAAANSTDVLAGGEGTDKLVLEDLQGSVSLTTTGIENVVISPNTAAATMSMANMTGVSSIEIVNGDESLDITKMSDLGLSLNLTGIDAGDTIEFQFTEASVAGTTDALSYTVTDSGTAANAVTVLVSDTTNGTSSSSIETANLTINGTYSNIVVDHDAKTLNISGASTDAKVTGQATTATVTSTSTGNVDFIAGATSQKFTSGAGDDRIELADSAGDVVDMGDGSDTVALTNVGTVSLTGSYSNYEAVEIAGATDTTIDVDTNFAGITSFVVSAAEGTTQAIHTIDDAATGSTVTVTAQDTTGTTNDHIVFNLATDGSADVLNLVLGTAATAADSDEIIADDPETINVTLGGKDGHDLETGITATDATNITIDGSGNADLGIIDMAASSTQTVDGQAATGTLTFTMNDSENQVIKGGAAADTVTLADNSLDALDDIDLGGGLDTLTVGGITDAIGALMDVSAETVNLTFAATTAAATTDLRLADISTLTIDGGATALSANLTLTSVAGATTVELQDFADTVSADTFSVTYAGGTTDATVVMEQFGASDTAAHGENFTVSGTTNLTIQSGDTDAAGDEEVFINTLTASTLTGLTINLATAGAYATSGAIGGAVDIDTLTAAALTSLTMTSASDNTNGINIDAAGTDASLTTIDGSGMAGSGDISLGLGSSIIGRAGDASITLGSGDDTLSFSFTLHGSNVIDMGTNTATTATEDGDLLSAGGVMTGNTVIDLSSTTDQITTMNGVANAAAQIGIDSVDLSGVTVSSGTVNVTGGATANTITTGSAIDTITGGNGIDVINGKGAADIIDLTEGTAASDIVVLDQLTGLDVITGFTTGASGDVVRVSVGGVASALIEGSGDAVAAGDTANIEDVTADEVLAATENIAFISGDFSTLAALDTALETGAAELSTTTHTSTAGEDVALIYDDGSHSYFVVANIDTVATAQIATVTLTQLAKFVGETDATTFVAGNFEFVA
jgi:hypothetical protein